MPEIPIEKRGISTWQAVSFVSEIGITIAVPTVTFALIGNRLDKYFNSTPWFLVLGLLASLATVAYLVTKKGRRIISKL
ncbi:AtpZ/AtpI family protein [Patescibacteria group bacterium]|nr:AtpZ/AtpI family protein [Patescibacteria group bacterium]MBU1034196.1 AtpZ/AtpI family protein [Patescibacteria group bacterium]MBU1629671.1 AtpZ/AtpI family protein [Patescibacteria group bacterium]MBU1907913.1 AtpZ/AtpI family protein [Patescibacteria group bacterium]